MKPSRRIAWASAIVPGLALALAVPMFGGAAWAAPVGAPSASVQPAVTLPSADLLESARTRGHSPVTTQSSPATESNQEIRRPAEPPAGVRAQAGSDNPGENGRLVTRESAPKKFWRMSDFFPLAVVLALLMVAAWAVKRYLPGRRLFTGSGVLEVVARLPLSPKQSLALIKMGRRMVLVGLTPERVSAVCVVDDPEQVAELAGRIASHSPDSSSRAFNQSLDEQAETFEETVDEESPRTGVRGLLEKVRQMSRTSV